ncbi:MAG: hypothetical protein AB7G47_22755 [Mycolicibacterium sp.]|uniref:hypothetical protein n=1 Tax=Mycolicibacterium sp. TaxID=2320850 RepID=UPI003D0D5586
MTMNAILHSTRILVLVGMAAGIIGALALGLAGTASAAGDSQTSRYQTAYSIESVPPTKAKAAQAPHPHRHMGRPHMGAMG